MPDVLPTIAQRAKKRVREILARLGVPMSCPTCGMAIDAKHSDPERKRHWGVIRAAWEQWPANIKLMDQINGPEDLRAWLYVKVGYCETVDLDLSKDADKTVDFVLLLTRKLNKKIFVRVNGSRGRIYIPLSAKKKECPHSKFWRLAASVNDEIERTLGVTTKRLLKEKDKAA